MKKFVIVTMMICMIFSQMGIGYASDNPTVKEIPQFSHGKLIDNKGNEYEIVGKLIDIPMQVTTETDVYAATYEYDVELNNDSSLSQNGVFDSTYSVKAYNTIYWKTKQGVSGTGYCLTKVTGYWIIQDSTVQVSNCKLRYGCTGVGTDEVFVTQSNEIASAPNNFNYTTGYDKYIYQELGSMGSNMTLTLKRGTNSVWTLFLENNLFAQASIR